MIQHEIIYSDNIVPFARVMSSSPKHFLSMQQNLSSSGSSGSSSNVCDDIDQIVLLYERGNIQPINNLLYDPIFLSKHHGNKMLSNTIHPPCIPSLYCHLYYSDQQLIIIVVNHGSYSSFPIILLKDIDFTVAPVGTDCSLKDKQANISSSFFVFSIRIIVSCLSSSSKNEVIDD
jgi:hypothetical protein